jgi:hypothetical protein|tara:strand:+ start:774 stop:950 length:177 start_codon:yes stop_codon:yes gene_type:complete
MDIWQASAAGKIDAVKYHLTAGVDVNVKIKNISGTTPLHEYYLYAVCATGATIGESVI